MHVGCEAVCVRRPRQKWSKQAKIIGAPLPLFSVQVPLSGTGLREEELRFPSPPSCEVARLPPHEGMTARCQLAKIWGLRSQLTTCTSQMSIQKKDALTTRPPRSTDLVQVDSMVAARGHAIQGNQMGSCSSCLSLSFSSLLSLPTQPLPHRK